MTTAISVNKYIYNILTSNTDLNKLVGKKIYPIVAEESTTFPFIVIKRTNIATEYCKDGKVNDRCDFTVTIAANNYAESVAIAEQVRKLIELKRNDYFNLIHLWSVSEDYIDNTYIQELTFNAILK